jgi:hypothetical protein
MLHLEERGPFDVDQAIQTIALVPPLDIHPNEMLAIVAVSRCGGPVRSRSRFPSLGSLVTPGETSVSCDLRFGGCPFVAGFRCSRRLLEGIREFPAWSHFDDKTGASGFARRSRARTILRSDSAGRSLEDGPTSLV